MPAGLQWKGFSRKLKGMVVESATLLGSGRAQNYSNDVDAFGLFLLHPQDEERHAGGAVAGGSKEPEATRLYNADIIAIHGLGGTAHKTWTHENGILWLRDIVPNELPGVRIYTFGYDSSFAFSKGTGTLSDFAKNLLEAIRLERTTPESNARPIILVCHSMGGIVAKLAITIARNESDHYPGIGKAVTAILFLGTPHQGSASARYATILAGTANALIIGSQISRLTGPIRSSLLKSLQRHEPELLRVAEDFRVHTANLNIISFIEGRNMKGMNSRIVDDHSAFVGASTERKIPMPGYDHREICRHGSPDDHGLKLLLGALKSCMPIGMSRSLYNDPTRVPEREAPPFVNIPFQKNSAFVGQQEVLEQLTTVFHGSHNTRQIALYGLGGIGKSQIALQYVHNANENDPDISIFWVFAGTKERFERDYMEIAKGLRLPGHNNPEVDIFNLVKTSLEKAHFGKWIMVIDNADDLSMFYGSPEEEEKESDTGKKCYPNGLFNYIPSCPSGSVLYTTRNKADALQLTSSGHIIQVREMGLKDLHSLLQTKLYGETPDEEQYTDLITTLDSLPLALVQAASYIRQNSWSIAKYLKYFRSKDTDLSFQILLHDFRDQTRDKTVANSVFKTWMITAQQLEGQHPEAAETLFMMAFYSSQNIPRYLLVPENVLPESSNGSECVTNLPSPKSNRTLGDTAEYLLDQAIGTLVAYSLINIAYDSQPESYSIHRLVQSFTRYWLVEHRNTADSWAAKAVNSLSREFPATEFENWMKSAQLLPHVLKFMDLQPVSHLPPLRFGVLLIACSDYLRMRAHYVLASKYAHLAIEILEKSPEEQTFAILDAKCSLALIYRSTARFQEAEQLLRPAIENYSIALGADTRTLSAVATLSVVLREQEKYEVAEKLARSAFHHLGDQDHLQDPKLAECRTKVEAALATVLGDTGQYKESLEIQQAILQRLLESHERKHPRVAQAQHNIAVTLCKDGQYAASRVLSSEILEFNRRFYGPDHPRTLNIEYNLGRVLEEEGDHGEAETHFRSVINSRGTNLLGKYDPETIDCIRSLTECLENQKKYQAANEYYQAAYQRLLESPGTKYVWVVALGEDLARTLKLTHHLAESIIESKEEPLASEPIHHITLPRGSGGGGGRHRHKPYARDSSFGSWTR